MRLDFTKMHGLGNDFIVVDCRDKVVSDRFTAIGELSKRLCHRRLGIGADQMLLLYSSETADFKMRIFNSDGSEVEMCGNGIRCLAKYIWDRGISHKDELSVETAAGTIKPVKADKMVRVDMGEPVLEARAVPVNLEGVIKNFPLIIDGKEFRITCVSMGNPHAVIFVDDVDGFDVNRYGPLIETHELFPKRTNVEFIQITSPERLKMRVWERGAGETMACGTGASAAAVAANLNGLTGKSVTVGLLGGELLIEWSQDNHVYMTGPAQEVFEGRIEV
jgi:diaminopimelate epimerase